MPLNISNLNPLSYLPSFFNFFTSSSPSDRTVYFDFCRMQYWKLTTPTLIKTYTQDLMSQFQKAHATDLSLAFAQVSNIDELENGTASDPQKDLFGYIITHYPDIFSSFVDQAHQHHIKVSLSFGGQTATSRDFLICQPGEDPAEQAQKLIKFIEKANLDGVNFDLEGDGATAFIDQNPQTLLPFLSALNQALHASQKTLTLTVGVNHDMIQKLSELFFNSQGQPQFENYFDGLYLMNYNNSTQYYIDANDKDADTKPVKWGMQKWIETVSRNQTTHIHIGFQDATPYENQSASAGKTYTIDTTDRSRAAYEVYQQLQQDLKNQKFPNQFAPPFFWPDENTLASRYDIDSEGKGDFKLGKIQKFYEYFLG